MQDSVAFADVAQEHIAQTFALARALHQTGNVYNFHGGRNHAFGVDNLLQGLQARIGNVYRTDVGFNRTEGEVGCLGLCVAQTVKKGGFAYVG